jgi:phage baseplate assembly protein W
MAASDSQNIFKGFSTSGDSLTKNWTYYDIDLIKIDLMNHFNTRVGERVMRPDWGCKIWDYMMEPLNNAIRDLIVAEAIRVCESDSRVSVNDVQVFKLGAGLRVEITLNYDPFAVSETFFVDFDARQDAEFGFQ